MTFNLHKGEKPTSIHDIDDNFYYTRTQLSEVKDHRSVPLNQILLFDPIAPKGVKFNTCVVTKGSEIKSYLSGNSEFQKTKVEEVAAEKVSVAKKKAQRILDDARAEAELIVSEARLRDSAKVVALANQLFLNIAKDISGTVNAKCGVYFLMKEGCVQYIGQSVNVYARVQTHRHYFDFDQVKLLPLPASDLDDIEGLLIRIIRPPLNGWTRHGTSGAPPSRYFTEFLDLTAAFEMTPDEVTDLRDRQSQRNQKKKDFEMNRCDASPFHDGWCLGSMIDQDSIAREQQKSLYICRFFGQTFEDHANAALLQSHLRAAHFAEKIDCVFCRNYAIKSAKSTAQDRLFKEQFGVGRTAIGLLTKYIDERGGRIGAEGITALMAADFIRRQERPVDPRTHGRFLTLCDAVRGAQNV